LSWNCRSTATREYEVLMPDLSHKKIALVVEDEPIISRVCRKTLMSEGYEVDIAMNGLIGKQMADAKSYDLCLSDIRTPGMNGIELYRYLEQAHPDLARKLIFTTGDVLSGNISEFLKEVKRPYLPKPFAPDELSAVVKAAQAEISAQIQKFA
jgi:CheY-like chemotaxis protein